MKKLVFPILLLMLAFTLEAQVMQPSDPKYLPSFNIQKPDGSRYRVTDLPMGKPVMLVYFDPECDHCVTFIGELLKNENAFKEVQIVMITYVPLRNLKSFNEKTGLDKHPAIVTGTEGNSFIVRYHYDIVQFPYVALHDIHGKLITTYESEVPPPKDLAKMF